MSEKDLIQGFHIATSQIAGNGGAVSATVGEENVDRQCNIAIEHCTFKNNTAESYGGTLFWNQLVKVDLYYNYFENSPLTKLRPVLGEILEARGKVVMINNTLEGRSASDQVPII